MTVWFRPLSALAVLVAASGQASMAQSPAIRFACLPPPETRDLLQTHAFIRPFRAMIEAAHNGQGEPIGIRMCRYDGQVVYTVMLLKRDGQLVRFLIDAEKGEPLNPQPPLPPPGGPRSLLNRIPDFQALPPDP